MFETTDEFTLDFDDRVNADGEHTASDVLIEGCTIKGAGYAGEKRFAYSICIEAPEGCVVRDNLIYRGYINTFKICKNEDPDPGRRPLIVEGNIFDLTADNGVDTRDGVSMIRLHGDNNIFRDNTIVVDLPEDTQVGDAPETILMLYFSRNAQIRGNRVFDHSDARPPWLFFLYEATDTAIASNFFWSKLPEGLKTRSQAGTAGHHLDEQHVRSLSRGLPRRPEGRPAQVPHRATLGERPDHPGRIAGGHRARWNRPRHHAAGSDHRAVTDGDSLEHDGAQPDEHVVLDADRCRGADVAAPGGGIEAVPVGVDDRHIGAAQHVVADDDLLGRADHRPGEARAAADLHAGATPDGADHARPIHAHGVRPGHGTKHAPLADADTAAADAVKACHAVEADSRVRP